MCVGNGIHCTINTKQYKLDWNIWKNGTYIVLYKTWNDVTTVYGASYFAVEVCATLPYIFIFCATQNMHKSHIVILFSLRSVRHKDNSERPTTLAHIVLRVLCFMLQIICYVFGLSSGCVAHRDAENCENVTQYMDNIYIIMLQIAVKHEDYFLWSCDICTIRDCYLVGTIFFLFRICDINCLYILQFHYFEYIFFFDIITGLFLNDFFHKWKDL